MGIANIWMERLLRKFSQRKQMNKTLKKTQRTQGLNYLTKKLFNHQSWSKVSFENTLLSVNISNSNDINKFCVDNLNDSFCAIFHSSIYFGLCYFLCFFHLCLIFKVGFFNNQGHIIQVWMTPVSEWQTTRQNNNQIWLGQKETQGSSLPQAKRRHICPACRLRRNFRRNGQTFSRTWQRSQCNSMSSLIMSSDVIKNNVIICHH